jgi:hypothetical protein
MARPFTRRGGGLGSLSKLLPCFCMNMGSLTERLSGIRLRAFRIYPLFTLSIIERLRHEENEETTNSSRHCLEGRLSGSLGNHGHGHGWQTGGIQKNHIQDIERKRGYYAGHGPAAFSRFWHHTGFVAQSSKEFRPLECATRFQRLDACPTAT